MSCGAPRTLPWAGMETRREMGEHIFFGAPVSGDRCQALQSGFCSSDRTCCAIISSSLVGITQPETRLPGVLMRVACC